LDGGRLWRAFGARFERTERNVVGPPARSTPALTAIDGKLVLFGGAIGRGGPFSYFSDTWEWNGVSWTEVDSSGPSARASVAVTAR